MAKPPWMKFYPSDWLGSSNVLMASFAQQGIFIRLLCIAWSSSGCQIPKEKDILYRLCAGARKEDVDKVVDNFFIPNGQGLINPRQHKEYCDAMERSDKARDNANHRWNKGTSNATALQGQCEQLCETGAGSEAQMLRSLEDKMPEGRKPSSRVLDIAHEKAHTAWTQFEHAIRKWALGESKLIIDDNFSRKIYYETKSEEWRHALNSETMQDHRDRFIRRYVEIEIETFNGKKKN